MQKPRWSISGVWMVSASRSNWKSHVERPRMFTNSGITELARRWAYGIWYRANLGNLDLKVQTRGTSKQGRPSTSACSITLCSNLLLQYDHHPCRNLQAFENNGKMYVQLPFRAGWQKSDKLNTWRPLFFIPCFIPHSINRASASWFTRRNGSAQHPCNLYLELFSSIW